MGMARPILWVPRSRSLRRSMTGRDDAVPAIYARGHLRRLIDENVVTIEADVRCRAKPYVTADEKDIVSGPVIGRLRHVRENGHHVVAFGVVIAAQSMQLAPA